MDGAGALRALMLYDRAPRTCGAVLVPDNALAPHLRAGERAIVDPDDNEPLAGEIYVVKISSVREPDGSVLRFVQLRAQLYTFGERDEQGGWRPSPEEAVGFMIHFQLIWPRPTPKFYATMEDAIRNVSTWTLCDGPLQADGMRSIIVGRVVGVVACRWADQ